MKKKIRLDKIKIKKMNTTFKDVFSHLSLNERVPMPKLNLLIGYQPSLKNDLSLCRKIPVIHTYHALFIFV